MTWKKHFQSPSALKKYNALQKQAENDPTTSSHLNSYSSRFASWLPDVYVGQPNRIERYSQYDNMDLDTEVSGSLDTIADSCTTQDGDSKLPFEFEYIGNVSEEEVVLLQDLLRQWYEVNSFEMTLWKMFRSVLKYGDQILIRDPETYKLYWVDHTKVESVIVDESKGKKPEQYVVRDLDLNLQTLVATGNMQNPSDQRGYSSGPLASGHGAGTLLGQHSQNRAAGNAVDGQYGGSAGLSFHVNADHIIHMSLSEGMDNVWPFGTSILENVFKAYKKKELIEDAVVIYRVQRAPERRVFYVDTGRLPTHKAHAYLERVKNEIQQKRIPSRAGGNSSVVDATYNPMCVSLSQTITLLDGRIITLQEAINEYESGKENWVYSINQTTHEMEPGKIAWAGVTRKNAEVIKVTLDNGEEVITTPDHRYIMRDGSEVEAQDLNIDDSLMPLYEREKCIRGDTGNTYTQYFDNSDKKWKFVHRTVAACDQEQTMIYESEYKDRNKTTVHHMNFNRYDNSPENLVWMDPQDHFKYHSDMFKNYAGIGTKAAAAKIKDMKENDPEAYAELIERQNIGRAKWRESLTIEERRIEGETQSTSLKAYWNNVTDDKKEKHIESITHNLKYATERSQWLMKHDVEFRKNMLQKRSDTMKSLFENEPDRRLVCKENNYKMWSDPNHYDKVFKNQTVKIDDTLLDMITTIISSGVKKQVELIKEINENNDFITHYREINANTCAPNFKLEAGFKGQHLTRLIKENGYKNYKEFVKSVDHINHKIVSIEWLIEREDTGDLTIESKSGNHNFALAAGVYVHNSMLEDYYFAQNADGKGSRVETLPGGDQLGEIDDLKYFNHQMRMGLRIPRSYMPDFNDGGGSLFNDGRIGTAYIEEYRYSRYCERLQNLIMPPLDTEFKLFCKHRGANIQSGLFNLRLVKPQNFSKYREIELDSATLSVYSQVADIPHISRRYGLMKYAGWNKDEILENERMWAEENEDITKKTDSGTVGASSFSDVGAGSSMGNDMGEFDSGDNNGEFDDIDLSGEEGTASPISGDEGDIGDLDI